MPGLALTASQEETENGEQGSSPVNPRVAIVFLLWLLMTALSGCASLQQSGDAAANPYDQLLQQAEALYKAEDVEGAKMLYRKAADADPTRARPWYQLAKINFDQQNYGRAIVDAQEVLKRNPTDSNAESILTVAGLRVAVEALGHLHEEADVHGPAHLEAKKLAAKMRETLGQNVLVPPASKARYKRPSPSRAQRAAQRSVPARTATPAKSAKTESPSGSNPFQSLPGGGQ
jgi:cytochrome c-type biogenesis protein CcmH/NrfG